jgi:hypothetical protein
MRTFGGEQDLAISTKVEDKINTAYGHLKDWKEGLISDQEARTFVAFSLCTALEELSEVDNVRETLTNIFKEITESPKYRQLS